MLHKPVITRIVKKQSYFNYVIDHKRKRKGKETKVMNC